MFSRTRRTRADFDAEIESHIDHEADRLVAEGMSRAEARAAARARFGSMQLARERFRGRRRGMWLDHLAHDVRIAVRSLGREPVFAVIAIVTLALGIGLNSTVYTFLYSLTQRTLPVPHAARLVTVHQQIGSGGPTLSSRMQGGSFSSGEYDRAVNGTPDMVSLSEYVEYSAQSRSVEELAAYAVAGATLEGETPLPVGVQFVSCNYFHTLGLDVARGREFTSDECEERTSAVVVLAHGFWQSRFGGDAAILGRSITLNRQAFTVIGIAPPGFTGTEIKPAELWAPLTAQPLLGPEQLSNEHLSWLALIGRLAPRTTLERARAELAGIARSRDRLYPGRATTVLVYRATVLPGPQARQITGVTGIAALAVATFIVLIACLNVANLVLSRVPARQRAVRVRAALGAQRRQIVLHLMVESLLLALLGGLGGMLVTVWAPSLLVAAVQVDQLNVDLSPDVRVFAYALSVSIGAALVFGLVPALETARVDLASALRGTRASARRGPRTWRLRQIVVGTQLAGSLLLLVLTGLFVRALVRAQAIDPGFVTADVYAYRPDLARQGYDAARAALFYDELRTRVAALAPVEATTFMGRLPLRGGRTMSAFSPDLTSAFENEVGHYTHANYVTVSASYFAALQIPIVRGRVFSDLPVGATPDVTPVVIAEGMARRFWPGEEPLGKQFRLYPNRVHEVVGVARETRHHSIAAVDDALMYRPVVFDVAPDSTGKPPSPPQLALVVRTAPGADLSRDVVRLARQLDPNLMLTVESLEGILHSSLRPARLASLFAGFLGGLAALLALVGVYGAVAYVVSQRAHEIGVRFALGARQRDVIMLILRQGAAPLVFGLGAGLLLAVAAGRVVQSQLYGIDPLDPLAFGGMFVVLAVAALLAMLRPARRAAQLDPVATLRTE
jgi:predicted permease